MIECVETFFLDTERVGSGGDPGKRAASSKIRFAVSERLASDLERNAGGLHRDTIFIYDRNGWARRILGRSRAENRDDQEEGAHSLGVFYGRMRGFKRGSMLRFSPFYIAVSYRLVSRSPVYLGDTEDSKSLIKSMHPLRRISSLCFRS